MRSSQVVAFASGGFLPASRHGLKLDGIIHNADWVRQNPNLSLFNRKPCLRADSRFLLPARALSNLTLGLLEYPTLSNLAGAIPDDPPAPGTTGARIPAVDGYDMWPYITGVVNTSPRTTLLISSDPSGGIISGDLKLIFGD